MNKKLTTILIEKGDDGKLWGRVTYRDNLLVDSATNVAKLEEKMKKLLKDFHNADVEFKYAYDVSAFFEKFNFLNQSKIAELAKINPGLLRQYASGTKHPSPEQAKKIETAIHQVAHDLKSVSLHAA